MAYPLLAGVNDIPAEAKALPREEGIGSYTLVSSEHNVIWHMSVSMQHLKQCQQLSLQVVSISKHAVNCLANNAYVRTRTS